MFSIKKYDMSLIPPPLFKFFFKKLSMGLIPLFQIKKKTTSKIVYTQITLFWWNVYAYLSDI